MKIVVYDIAASSGGGGETILDQYYYDAVNDRSNEWWFFVSINKYLDTNNVHIELFEDYSANKMAVYVKRLFNLRKVKKKLGIIEPDEVVSLQNMAAPGNYSQQTVYLHQSLQFAPIRFSFFKIEECSLAFRQKIICNMIRFNMKKADKVIVQTQWMKEATAKWANYPIDKIEVVHPRAIMEENIDSTERRHNCFIYPCNGNIYKNHKVLLEACRVLKRRGVNNYLVEMTIMPNNLITRQLACKIEEEKLPISLIGHLDKRTLFKKYIEEIVLFPSYIETFGLPLLEAKKMKSNILASDLPFSHEILDDYDRVVFVKFDDAQAWADEMQKHIDLVY